MSVFSGKRSQSLVEYSLILAIVGAALIGMFTYMKRGIQSTVKTAADQLGDQVIATKLARTVTTTTKNRTMNSGTARIKELLGGLQMKLMNSAELTYIRTDSKTTTKTN